MLHVLYDDLERRPLYAHQPHHVRVIEAGHDVGLPPHRHDVGLFVGAFERHLGGRPVGLSQNTEGDQSEGAFAWKKDVCTFLCLDRRFL